MTPAAGKAHGRVSGEWLSGPAAQAVFRAIAKGGFTARAVGGAVRNSLLGLAVADVDIATDATPAAVIRLAAAANLKTVPTGLGHGTVTVISGGRPFEVTTLRRDVTTDGRHAVVAFTDDWAEDAARRDFTINALYCDGDGTVFDPLGGATDLAPVRVRFIGDPVQRIREDYLRILRFFRFTAAYTAEGALDRAGLDACVAERAGLARISGERIRAELFKLLIAPHAVAVTTALVTSGVFDVLLGLPGDYGALGLLVERERRAGVEGNCVRRLAALAVFDPEDVVAIDRRLKLPGADRSRLMSMAERYGLADPGLGETALNARLYAWGREGYEDAVLLGWARYAQSKGQQHSQREWLAAATLPQRFVPPEFPLTGRDLMALGYREGPGLGEALRRLEEAWLAAGFAPDRDGLLAMARGTAPDSQS